MSIETVEKPKYQIKQISDNCAENKRLYFDFFSKYIAFFGKCALKSEMQFLTRVYQPGFAFESHFRGWKTDTEIN